MRLLPPLFPSRSAVATMTDLKADRPDSHSLSLLKEKDLYSADSRCKEDKPVLPTCYPTLSVVPLPKAQTEALAN